MTAKPKPIKFVTSKEHALDMSGVSNNLRQLEIKLERMVNSLHQQQESRWKGQFYDFTTRWNQRIDQLTIYLWLGAAGLAMFALLMAVYL